MIGFFRYFHLQVILNGLLKKNRSSISGYLFGSLISMLYFYYLHRDCHIQYQFDVDLPHSMMMNLLFTSCTSY